MKDTTKCSRALPVMQGFPNAVASMGLHVFFPVALAATVLLVALFLAGFNHFAFPSPSPLEAPLDEFSEGRALLLLQPAAGSVRTFGSCDNEVAAPLLLHSFVMERLLLLSHIYPATGVASGSLGEVASAGLEMQAVVGRLSYLLLVTHELRSVTAAADAADAAAVATQLRRISPPGQPTDIQTCLCGVEQQHHLLLQQQQQHKAAAAAAVAAGLHDVLLQQTREELPPLCSEQQRQTECAGALRRTRLHDPFSPSAAAAAVAAFEAKGQATAAQPGTWEELECTDSPRFLDPDAPQFVAGTLIPKVQCFRVTRLFLSPPSTVSALIGLVLGEREQQQQVAAAIETPYTEERKKEQVYSKDKTEKDSLRQVLQFVGNMSAQERGHCVAAAAAARAAAEAAGSSVLQRLSRYLLSLDVGLWGGAAGGFALNYAGTRTALYAGPRNFTMEIKPAFPSHFPDCSSRGGPLTAAVAQAARADATACARAPNNNDKGRGARDALMLAAHYDSAPSSPGISDDLSMCAVALEVARAGVYRHLRAAHALQLHEWGLDRGANQAGREDLMPAPLIVNLNGRQAATPRGAMMSPIYDAPFSATSLFPMPYCRPMYDNCRVCEGSAAAPALVHHLVTHRLLG